jgi:Tol biopolymer transport system component
MRYAILLVPLLALLAIACNGGEESTPTPSPAVLWPSPTPSPTPPASLNTLAFLRDGDLWLINADGSDERRITHFGGTDREVVGFQWLDNGQLITYSVSLKFEPSTPPPNTITSVLASVDSTVLWEKELPRFLTRVLWSPDGQLVALLDQTSVSIQDREGRPLWTGTFQYPPFGGEAWARDGKALAFIDGEEIVVVSGDPLAAQKFHIDVFSAGCPPGPGCPASTARYGVPEFVPDAKSLVIAVAREGEIGATGNANFALYRVGLDPGLPVEPVLLFPSSPTEQKDFGQLPSPAFAPDGSYLAYWTSSRLSVCESFGRIMILRADGSSASAFIPQEIGEAQASFTPTGPDAFRGAAIYVAGLGFSWSPSSDAMVAGFQMRDCSFFESPPVLTEGIYIVRAADLTEEKIADEFPLSVPVWSPSGDFIAYASGDADAPQLRVINLATQGVTDLGFGAAPAWQPQP